MFMNAIFFKTTGEYRREENGWKPWWLWLFPLEFLVQGFREWVSVQNNKHSTYGKQLNKNTYDWWIYKKIGQQVIPSFGTHSNFSRGISKEGQLSSRNGSKGGRFRSGIRMSSFCRFKWWSWWRWWRFHNQGLFWPIADVLNASYKWILNMHFFHRL